MLKDKFAGLTDDEIAEIRKRFFDDVRTSMAEVLRTPEGTFILGFVLSKLGLFSEVFVKDSRIYRRAGLHDVALDLYDMICNIDEQAAFTIHKEWLTRITFE
jgi:hypothetical protein